MVQLDISLVRSEAQKKVFGQVQAELNTLGDRAGRLEQGQGHILTMLDEHQVGYKALQRYIPLLEQLHAAGLDGLATNVTAAIEQYVESDDFGTYLNELLAQGLQVAVAEVRTMFDQNAAKTGAVALDQKMLKDRVDIIVGRVDAHDKDIMGLKASRDGHEARLDNHEGRIKTLEDRPVGTADAGSELAVWGAAALITTLALYAISWFFLHEGKAFNEGRTFMICAVIGVLVGAIAAKTGGDKSNRDSSVKFKDRMQGFKQPNASSASTPANTTTPPPAPTPVQTTTTTTTPSPAMAGSTPSNN